MDFKMLLQSSFCYSYLSKLFYFSEEVENGGKLRIQIHLYFTARERPYL